MAAERKDDQPPKKMSKKERKKWLTFSGSNDKAVEVGRIAIIIWGKNDYRKLVTIVDLIDRNRVVVDGAGLSNVRRQSYPLRRLQMTKYRINIVKDIDVDLLKQRVADTKVYSLWKSSAAGRRNTCQVRREAMNDFQRWKLQYYKNEFKKAVAQELLKLRSESMIARAKEAGEMSEADIQAKYSVDGLRKRNKKARKQTPVLRRVTGRFKKKLAYKTAKKAERRYLREVKYAKYVGAESRIKRVRRRRRRPGAAKGKKAAAASATA